MRRLSSLPLLLLLLPCRLVAAEPPPAPPALPAAPALGHWEGVIQVPGIELRVLIDLSQKDNALAGTIDIPQQGAKGLPLDAVALPAEAEGKIHFAIRGVPGAPTFDGTLAGSEIKGIFSQGGQSFPFHLGREVVPPPARPQEPKPPFPYTAEEVHYENNGIKLAGTLTLPPGDGPFPAVLLLTGSGAQNRDEEIFGHKPFLVIADHLTRAGIAVLRMDDRGVGGSTGSVARSTTADFADDALAGVQFLKTHPHIAPHRIGLLGHSEGGIIAPLAATRSRDVAFVILLAGTGVPGSQVILDQGARIGRVEGEPEERIRQQTEGQKKVFELLLTEKDPAALRTKLRDLLRAQIAALPETERKTLGDNLDLAIDRQVEQALTPWFRYFLAYDPRPALTQLKVPVLALNGEKDLQVAAELNLPAIAQALKMAKNRDVTLKRLPNLNHLFQHATTGDIAEYAKSEETISPEVLDLVTKWILVRFGKGEGKTGKGGGQKQTR
jgi:pimeloyl-ACP methyl ester carboxylesterase